MCVERLDVFVGRWSFFKIRRERVFNFVLTKGEDDGVEGKRDVYRRRRGERR